MSCGGVENGRRRGMAKKGKAKHDRTPSHEIVPDGIARAALKVDDETVMEAKLNELADLLWHREGESQEEAHLRAVRALEHFNSLEPADGAEGMLARQMVGTHFAALECLRRAALPSQTFEGRDMALRHAQRLMALYTRQLETLDKHRGKGQQRVTVEHIRVEQGGRRSWVTSRLAAGGQLPPLPLYLSTSPMMLCRLRCRKRRPSGERRASEVRASTQHGADAAKPALRREN
jgi:hypothetical protein